VDLQSAYRLGYVPHNYHFGWSTATLEGRSELAIRLAQEMAGMVNAETMRVRPLTTLQHYWITPIYAYVRFGKWDRILNLDEPAEDLVYPGRYTTMPGAWPIPAGAINKQPKPNWEDWMSYRAR